MKISYLFTVAILFTYTSLMAQALNGNYTVGGNNPDFVSISDAVTALDINGLSAPVTFNIRPGVYEENAGSDRVLYFPQQITGVSAANTITFQPDNANGGNVDNVVLRRIVGSYDEKGWIAEIQSDGVSLKQLTFDYADTSTAGYHPNTSFGLVFFQSGGVTSGINDITVTGCKMIRTSSVQRSPQGIFVSNAASNISITNNLIDGSKDGIIMVGSSSARTDITISGNTILNLQTNVTAVGNWQGYGIRVENGKDNVVIRNNIIDYRSGAYGVAGIKIDTFSGTGSLVIEANQILNGQNDRWNQRRFDGIHYTSGYGQAKIINNMVSSRSPGSGIHINAPNCLVSFNTVVQTSAAVAGLESADVLYLGKSGNTVVNNIFIQLMTTNSRVLRVMQIQDTTGNIIDYNCLYKSRNDDIFVKANGVTYDSFINWQGAGNGLHSIEKYPEFVNILLDLHLDGCSIYDPELQIATPLTDFLLDLDSEERAAESPFLGADEAFGTLPDIFAPVAITPTGDEALHFTSADLDGDGDNDFAVANHEIGTDEDGFWLGFESGGQYPVSSGSSPLHANLSVGDIDGDDQADILVGVWGISSEGLTLLRNKGDGTFSPKEDFFIDENRYSETFSLLDYEGDSDLDLIVATQYHDLIFFRNDGAGNFEKFLLCQRSELGGEPLTILSASLDGDLLPDIAVLTISDDIAVMSNLDFVSGVSPDKPQRGLVQTFQLHQNYPNPFNPVTVINYQISIASHITLTVFDILGRKVKVLIDEPQVVGDYSVSFDASTFASGVYVYKLEAGAYVQSRKMILLR